MSSEPPTKKAKIAPSLSMSSQVMEEHLQMNLYKERKLDQILVDAIREAYKHGDSLTPTHFEHLDNLHYEGSASLRKFLDGLSPVPSKSSRILDVGAGVGGPARFMSYHYQCQVVAVEYVPQIVRVGQVLNKLMGLSTSVKYQCGDFTSIGLKDHGLEGEFDAATSQLSFLHIPDKERLFQQFSDALKPGASFMIEDYYKNAEFSKEEKTALEKDVAVPDGELLSLEEYKKRLEEAGLQIDHVQDKTVIWASFIWNRLNAFLQSETEMTNKHGPEYTSEMKHFYAQTARLFAIPFLLSQKELDDCKSLALSHAAVFELLTERYSLPAVSSISVATQAPLGGVLLIGHKPAKE